MGSLVKKYSKKKLTGRIFTPFFIVNKILDDIGYNTENILKKTILDPACGDGRFLIKIVERIIEFSKNSNEIKNNLSYVYGWDIDESAILTAINKLNKIIEPYNINVKWNIFKVNSLHNGGLQDNLFHSHSVLKKFDYIVGNPPYIRIQHLDLEKRKFIQENYHFCKSGSTDIYIAFYELAISLLKSTGKCGYITPNTFFHTDTAKDLRNYFISHKNLIQITNYRHIQLFEDATTYSAIVIFDKKKREFFLFQLADTKTKFRKRFIKFSELKKQKFWQLSINKIITENGKRLGDIAKIHVGITTLSDKIYIMHIEKEKGDYIYLASKYNNVVKIEKNILKPIIKVSTLKKANEPIKEYILFPYKKVNNQHIIIPEEELKINFPFAYKYLQSVKKFLDKRDNGKPNPVAWYAFGRTQSLNTSFGEKILFSPMNKKPNFIYHKNKEATFYSGYCIKYEGNNKKLLKQLNSKRMEDFISVTSRDFRGGWKAYNKKIVQEFIIYRE
jgi:methylase of polypeptide subunit release factors